MSAKKTKLLHGEMTSTLGTQAVISLLAGFVCSFTYSCVEIVCFVASCSVSFVLFAAKKSSTYDELRKQNRLRTEPKPTPQYRQRQPPIPAKPEPPAGMNKSTISLIMQATISVIWFFNMSQVGQLQRIFVFDFVDFPAPGSEQKNKYGDTWAEN